MKRLFSLLFLLALAACVHTPAPTATPEPVRAMTFNIRLDTQSDGPNAWPHRKEMVAALISHERPHLLGMQEVLLSQKQYLEAALPQYDVVGVGRDDGVAGGEFSPLFIDRTRYALLDSGTFWLSETPGKPSTGWDAALPRIATWAEVQDRRSGQQLRVLNTHFDHVGERARAESARLIGEWASASIAAGIPVIVMGDLNSAPGSEPYAVISDAQFGLVDTRGASKRAPYGPTGTFSGFDIARNAEQPIDHVFVSPGVSVASYAVLTQHWGGRLPSDHYPVLVDLLIED
ncbi:endonuclease/exonuclease/phosphatase family protein [Qipengyuania sp. JC766]|uniref:endonuclease/exonuclease/phosphatase family protein n=1 Tax=Qipengyuania sp. JC766 TaxID=3232139 RepID=UPI00345ADB02